MSKNKVYIYRNTAELRKFLAKTEQKVYPFAFITTQEQLKQDTNIVIDVSSLIYRLRACPGDILGANANLAVMGENTMIIVKEDCSDDVINFFPYLFEEKEYLYINPKQNIEEIKPKTIYTYKNTEELILIRDFCKEREVYVVSFPKANDILTRDYSETNNEMEIIIDLTSLAIAFEGNKSIPYLAESFFGAEKKNNYIVKISEADRILEQYPLYFDKQDDIRTLYSDLEIKDTDNEEKRVLRIVDDNVDLDNIIKYIENNLFGHSYFKKTLKKGLSNYVRLFKAGEVPVYSIFLFGKSGIGKTQVARLICEAMDENAYLAKINFQNYSSQDALNSLIGSPAGYIGCEHGELSEKISKSRVGVLLCDEFEKTTRPVFSFFLQLLEEGKFTDSLAREYDLSGYIIVFTSNIIDETGYKQIIPQELQTRFDLVCEFEEPLNSDKRKFLNYLLEKALVKYDEAKLLTDEDKAYLSCLEKYETTSLRELKKEFNNRLMDIFNQK